MEERTNKPVLRVIPGGKPSAPQGPSLSLLASLLCRWLMSSVRVDPDAVARVKQLSAEGSLVFTMRYRSLVDYLLASYILMREGLPVPEFGNDVPLLLLRPLREIVSTLWRRLRAWRSHGRQLRRFEDRDRARRMVMQARPIVIFMRSRASGVGLLSGKRTAMYGRRAGADYLQEIVHAVWNREQRVFVVPLAVIRGKGFRRRESRLATLLYSVQEAPGEAKRLFSLAWNREDSQLSIGTEIPLREFIEVHREEGEERVVRRLSRALQIFLYREERVVLGPHLLPKREVQRLVLQGDDLQAVIRQAAETAREPESKVRRRAERYFNEMAANFHGPYFAILEYAFNKIWPRVFQGLEYSGLEKVIECVKKGPVVLVPCHRSHFDYLILSYIFHNNYLSPPHIAAGINLSFWPMGPLFRGAGAYFIRRTFEGNPLYKMVFRNYLTFLIREGYTQEFFIEGGRSRTGKILTPKLGMLSAIVHAFLEGVRRDLYFVPVSIHYGRVVEEEAYQRELEGEDKAKETLGALIKARSVLKQKYGTAYVCFAEPISLNEALGERKANLRGAAHDPAVEDEARRFIRKLGFRLLRAVNEASVVGATSISSTILLGTPHAAIRVEEFLRRARALADLLRAKGVQLTASLERNLASDFRESMSFLEGGGLVQRIADGGGAVLHVLAQKRLSLDFYKNNSIHFFLLPALLANGLARGLRGAALRDDVSRWLDLYRWEFALPERGELASDLSGLLDYFRAQGAMDGTDGEIVHLAHPLIQALVGLLDTFQEAYWIAARTIADMDKPLARKALIESMRKRYQTALLLGEVLKPEGRSSVIFGNAIDRFREMGLLTLLEAAKSRDRVYRKGREDALAELIGQLAPARQLSVVTSSLREPPSPPARNVALS